MSYSKNITENDLLSIFDYIGLGKTAIILNNYPIGSYYETSDQSFDPNTDWGGTWTSEQLKDDEVVEEGTSGIWTYRKWKSGIAECWGYKSSSYTKWNTWGNVYETDTHINEYYPTNLFISEPTDFVKTDLGGSNTFAEATGGGTSGTPDVYALRGTAGPANGTFTANYLAKGYWKTYTAPTTIYRWHRIA